MQIVDELLPDGKPNDEYRRILAAQRKWLLENGTAEAHAKNLVEHIGAVAERPEFENTLTWAAYVSKSLQFHAYAGKEAFLFKTMLFKKRHPRLERVYRSIVSSTPAIRKFISARLLHERPAAG